VALEKTRAPLFKRESDPINLMIQSVEKLRQMLVVLRDPSEFLALLIRDRSL
jgi:hypothetical protein